jgi:hypothetical protein
VTIVTDTRVERIASPHVTIPVGATTAPTQPRVAARPWSAVICGQPDDNTLLIVDWLLLACRSAGYVAHAVPLLGDDRHPHGMYLEVAATAEDEAQLSGTPWGAVDLVVAGEHLELVRAITAGYVDRDVTVVVASCRRAFTQMEHAVAPQHVLSEREIDELARVSARAYHAFDGPEVARWYSLPSSAQAGLLLGAIFGTGVTSLGAADLRTAIDQLGIDAAVQLEALRRGHRLGRREGGRIRRARTAYQFTRRRRAHVAHESRLPFEALVARCDEIVAPEHVPALQDAIYQLTLFQDAAWASRIVEHVADIAREERALLGDRWRVEESVVPDAIRSLAALLTWQDGAWIAASKRRDGRLKELRAAHAITRNDAYQLVEHIPLDAMDQAELRAPRLRGNVNPAVPAILRPMRVERIETTSLSGAMKLRRMARAARWRTGSERQLREIDTAETWLTALFDAMRADHELGRIVARSGTLVQGAGAVRDANRQTALAFWGRIVRQTLAIDRQVTGSPTRLPEQSIARIVIPFVWLQLARSGPLALWEYATPVVQIAMARARGVTHEAAYAHAVELCGVRRPLHDAAS